MSGECFREYRLRKAFTLDVDEYVSYYKKLFAREIVCLGCPLLIYAPCQPQNLRDYAEAVTVGVTSKEVVFCKEKTKTCWRLSPCDSGKVVKQIPFSQITDIEVVEPAGDCLPARALYRVNIQTASRSGAGAAGAELSVVGLKKEDAYELRSLVTRQSQVMRRV